MSELESADDKLRSLRAKLAALMDPTPQFNQLERAKRVSDVQNLCDEAVAIRDKGKEEWALWQDVTALLHRAIDEAYAPDFDEQIELLKAGNAAGLETAVQFLEADPWFFRSGYVKADLLKYIGRIELTETYKARLRTVILNVIDYRGRREFVAFCRLAKKIQDRTFRQDVQTRVDSADSGIRRRARWMLSAITHNKIFHLDRGEKQLSLNNYSDALGDFNRALLLAPQSLEAILHRGIAYGNLEMFEEAIADFDQMMGVHDDSLHYFEVFHMKQVDARLQRAWCYSNIYEYSKAVDDYSGVISVDHEEWYAYRGRGHAHYNLGDYDSAEADLQKSLLIRDTHRAHYLLGLTYMKQLKLELGLEELKKSIAADEDNYDSLVELSNSYFMLKDYQQAYNCAEQAVAIKQDAAIGICYRGKALFSMHSHALAFADFDKSVELGWAWPVGFLERGIAFAKHKNFHRATEDLNRALIIEPQPDDDIDVNALRNRARTWLGWIHACCNENTNALEQFSAAIDLNSENSYSWRGRGQAQFHLGMYEPALTDLRKSISLLDTSQARLLVALIYRKQLRHHNAIRQISRAIKLKGGIARAILRRLCGENSGNGPATQSTL